jgi:HK97 family phage major capsid protein
MGRITWGRLVESFQAAGYDGKADDLAAVKLWLEAEGRDTDTVQVGDDVLNLADLHATREGKPFDASAVAEKAERDAEVDERVRKALDQLGLADRDTKAGRRPDVSVGKDRLVDDPKGGYDHAGQFFMDVVKAGTRGTDKLPSERLHRWQKASLSTFGSEATGADGGFAVPTEFRENITRLVQSEDSLFSRADQLPISTASIALPDDETTPWGTNGPAAYWEGEADAMAQSKPNLKLKEYRLRKLTALVPVTEELLEDATAMGAYVNQVAPERIRWKADEAMIRGNGSGQPLGFLNSPSLITQAAEGSQTADTLSGVNVINMYSRMFAPYRQGGVWLYHQDVEPYLFRLSTEGVAGDGTDATGFGFPLFSPPGSNRNSGPYPTILGRPAIATQHAATLGDVGDIMFIAPQQYRFVMRSGGIQAATSMHLWFDQDATAFKFRMRADGAPKLSSTISPRTGTNTMSAFVALAARS